MTPRVLGKGMRWPSSFSPHTPCLHLGDGIEHVHWGVDGVVRDHALQEKLDLHFVAGEETYPMAWHGPWYNHDIKESTRHQIRITIILPWKDHQLSYFI